MQLKGHNLDADCVGVRFETGQLYFACKTTDPNAIAMVIVPPQDPDYLAAMTWAITNNKLA